MKKLIYYCENADYKDERFKAIIKDKIIIFDNGKKIEVTYDLSKAVSGLSDGRFNVMFEDIDDSLDFDDRKYFAKLNYFEIIKLKLDYGNHFVQNPEHIKWMIGIFCSFLTGAFLSWLKFKW